MAALFAKLDKVKPEYAGETTACEAPFYLTGGTALHRHFFGFRYSDDLDLFVTGNDRKAWQARRLNIALHRRPGKTWRLFGEFGDGVEPTFR